MNIKPCAFQRPGCVACRGPSAYIKVTAMVALLAVSVLSLVAIGSYQGWWSTPHLEGLSSKAWMGLGGSMVGILAVCGISSLSPPKKAICQKVRQQGGISSQIGSMLPMSMRQSARPISVNEVLYDILENNLQQGEYIIWKGTEGSGILFYKQADCIAQFPANIPEDQLKIIKQENGLTQQVAIQDAWLNDLFHRMSVQDAEQFIREFPANSYTIFHELKNNAPYHVLFAKYGNSVSKIVGADLSSITATLMSPNEWQPYYFQSEIVPPGMQSLASVPYRPPFTEQSVEQAGALLQQDNQYTIASLADGSYCVYQRLQGHIHLKHIPAGTQLKVWDNAAAGVDRQGLTQLAVEITLPLSGENIRRYEEEDAKQRQYPDLTYIPWA